VDEVEDGPVVWIETSAKSVSATVTGAVNVRHVTSRQDAESLEQDTQDLKHLSGE
jgi:isoaspartyl peptidase/L-asparaginase-like protein (Ntn-hydrolase superfamily)